MARTVIGEPPEGLKQAAKEYGARVYNALRAAKVGDAFLLGTIPAGGTFEMDFRPIHRTCLSCGAKTNDQGEIPCGH